ncbi:MAG: DUF1080 domain-containing protein [Planctomycetaceae bacterium]|nr:DUF1080 domain-containing protein [Planctomycetaceae bacterium]
MTLLTVVAAAGLHAEDKPAIKSAADQPVDDKTEWQSLFDGQTLNNWDATDYGGQGSVLVKDGLLVLEAGEPLTGVTWKGKALPTNNYEIRLEAQKVEGSDFFLALTFPVQEKHVSLVLGGWGGGVTGISSINGFDASENETTDYYGFDRKKWYKVRVRVTDDAIQAWLDDERICNVETAGKRFDTRIEVDLNKPLGMATFQTVAAYRNIEYRDLTAEQSPAATEAQPRKGE